MVCCETNSLIVLVIVVCLVDVNGQAISFEDKLESQEGVDKSKRYRDPYTPLASACDSEKLTFRGTDNRWFLRPESVVNVGAFVDNDFSTTGGIMPGVSFEDLSGSSNSLTGVNTGVGRGLLTHCPDSRTILCDPKSKLFHAPNYVSLPVGDPYYKKFGEGVFGYAPHDEIDFRCEDYTSTKVMRQYGNGPILDVSSPAKKLVFHSLQVIGSVQESTSKEGRVDKCDSVWGGAVLKNPNPPFFCVYSVVSNTDHLNDSPACGAIDRPDSGLEEEENPLYHHLASRDDYITDPHCGLAIVESNKTSDTFFQVWLHPVDWEGRYDWTSIYFRDFGKSNLGYRTVAHQLADRFVDCVPQAKKRRGGVPLGSPSPVSELCLPAHLRFERNPILLHSSCAITRQIECSPPPGAMETSEGTECFCSFPYHRDVSPVTRDPWDTYCFAGDLSSPNLDGDLTRRLDRIGSLHGNDVGISSDMMQRTQRIRELSDFKWTYYDWTPIFTAPQQLFTCPPPGYLTVVKERERWYIVSAYRPEYYSWGRSSRVQEGQGDPTFFNHHVVNWVAAWPNDIPVPSGPEARVVFDELWERGKSKNYRDPGDIEKEIKGYLKFKDYKFNLKFKKAELKVTKDRKGARERGNGRTTASGSGEGSGRCRLSEGARHYSSIHETAGRWSLGAGVTCYYDLSMKYTETKKVVGANGMKFEEKEMEFESHNLPVVLGSSEGMSFFGRKVYLPYGYMEARATPWYLSQISRGNNVDSLAEDEVIYTCVSKNGGTSECPMSTTANVVSAAIYSGERAKTLENNKNVNMDWRKLSHFGGGICSTISPTLIQSNQDREIFQQCSIPDSTFKEMWYKNVVGFQNEQETYSRFFYDTALEANRIGVAAAMPSYNPIEKHGEEHCDVTTSVFYSFLFDESILKEYLKASSTNAKVTNTKINSFKYIQCPSGFEIIHHPGVGFKSRAGFSWEKDWIYEITDHELFLKNGGTENVADSKQGYALNIGNQDVDSTTIRLISVYESVRYQCKYTFQTSATLQFPHQTEQESYYRIPQFFYLSARVADINPFLQYSRSATVGVNPCENDEDPLSTGLACSNCQIRIDPLIFDSKRAFLESVPSLLLCNPTESRLTQGKPESLWAIFREGFAKLHTPPFSEIQVKQAVYYEVESGRQRHPLHSQNEVKFCVVDSFGGKSLCQLVSLTVPCKTSRQFVVR